MRTWSRRRPRGHPGDPLRRPAPHPRGHLAAGVHLAARARAARCAAPSARWRPWTTRRRPRRAARTAQSRSSIDRRRPRSRRWRRTAATSASSCTRWAASSQGIVHVIGPELGLTQPGMTIVCGDSHTSTHGAFGALAFGIGTSEVGARARDPVPAAATAAKTLAVTIDGKLGPGVTAKDIILAVIARLGIGGGTGHVIEYRGSAIRGLSMEERMTVCNMSIEAGARAGMIAPDDTTFQYLEGRPRAPTGAAWDAAVAAWRQLPVRRRRHLRPRGEVRRRGARADDHLRHQPRHGHRHHRARPRAGQRHRMQKALALHGARGQQAAARAPGRRRVHRQLHQLAPVRPARRRRRVQGAQGRRRRARAGRARIAGGSRRRPRPRGWTACSWTRAPSGARRAARCASR